MSEPPNLVESLNDTDGLVWGLYYHLWKKTHKGLPCPDINIPHTVLYQDSDPIAWYFTSLKENKIYRKKKSNVSGQQIWESFSHGQDPEVDVCAWFSGNMTLLATSPKKAKKKSGSKQGSDDIIYELYPEEEEKEAASFEYLPHDRVHLLTAPGQYTVQTEEIYDGLLQKFVMPREAADSIIKATWSPTACVVERRINRYALRDERQPLNDRMASFEQNNFWLNTHQQLPAGSVPVQRLEAQCETIVKHLRDTSAGRVSVARMELFFKVDAVNRIWLLYCNSLRLDKTVVVVDRSPGGLTRQLSKQYTLRDPRKHDADTRIPVDDTPFMCVLTGEQCPGALRCDVTYKLLMQAWFAEAAGLANEGDRIQALDSIPPAIRRANPNITREYYLRMRSQPMFLLKTAPVSAEAAAELSHAALNDLARTITRPRSALADSAAAHTTTNFAAGATTGVRSSIAGSTRQNAAAAAAAARESAAGLDGDVLYQPGQAIPAALMPKQTIGHGQAGASGRLPPAKGSSPNSTAKLTSTHGSSSSSPGGAPRILPNPGSGRMQGQGRSAPVRNRPPPVLLPSPAGATPAGAAPDVEGSLGHSRRVVFPPALQPKSKSPSRSLASTMASTQGQQQQQQMGSTGASGSLSTIPERRGGGGSPTRPGMPYLSGAAAAAQASKSRGGSASAGAGHNRRPSHVSEEDMKTLKELSDAYASAEAVTQELLAQAKEVLAEPPPAAARRPSHETAGSPAGAGAGRPGSGSKRVSGGSRPMSASQHAAGSRPPSGGAVKLPAALAAKPGGVGLTTDEAALLSEALAEG